MDGDELFFNSSALLAIHAAISYADALRAGLGDQRLSSEEHSQAAEKLMSLLSAVGISQNKGVRHLQHLIANKSRVAYEARSMGP